MADEPEPTLTLDAIQRMWELIGQHPYPPLVDGAEWVATMNAPSSIHLNFDTHETVFISAQLANDGRDLVFVGEDGKPLELTGE